MWNVLDRTNTISIEISCVNDVSGNRECLRPLTALNQSSDYTIKTITIQNDTLLQRESIVVSNNRVWTKIQYFSFFFRLFASCLTLFSTHSVLCKSVKVSETLARLTSVCYTWKRCFWAKSVCSNIIPIVHAGSGSVSRLRDKRRVGGPTSWSDTSCSGWQSYVQMTMTHTPIILKYRDLSVDSNATTESNYDTLLQWSQYSALSSRV